MRKQSIYSCKCLCVNTNVIHVIHYPVICCYLTTKGSEKQKSLKHYKVIQEIQQEHNNINNSSEEKNIIYKRATTLVISTNEQTYKKETEKVATSVAKISTGKVLKCFQKRAKKC